MAEPGDKKSPFFSLLSSIEKARPRQVSSEPDPKSLEEQEDLERQKVEVLLRSEEQDISERKKYAWYFFLLSSGWVAVISVLLFLEGFGGHFAFRLSDSVLLAAIGSTTANILGIIYVVANYLFPKR